MNDYILLDRQPPLATVTLNRPAQRNAISFDMWHELASLIRQLDADPVRRALDDAVCAALGLDGELVATIRRNLAAEPSVTGRRYSGLRPA